MTDALALKYRPARFAEMQGQPAVSLVLPMMVARRQVPPALLLHGVRGSGKTSAARILARAMNCLGSGDGEPCGSCANCASASSLDVMEVDAASNGQVDQIRKICDVVAYDTVGDEAQYRVVLLDEAHGVSRTGFDVMLKTLEEPPEHARFVLVTTEPDKIPATVYSRCMPFRFQRIPAAVIIARLAHITAAEQLAVEPGVLPVIADRADGSMRDAIMLLDQMRRAGYATAEQFFALTGESDFAPGLVEVMATQGFGEVYAALDGVLSQIGDCRVVMSRVTRCLRDVMVLRARGTLALDGAALERRRRLASLLPEQKLLGGLRVLWDVHKMPPGTEPRIMLDLAVVMCAEQLGARLPAAAAPVLMPGANGGHKVTQDEVQRLLAGG